MPYATSESRDQPEHLHSDQDLLLFEMIFEKYRVIVPAGDDGLALIAR